METKKSGLKGSRSPDRLSYRVGRENLTSVGTSMGLGVLIECRTGGRLVFVFANGKPVQHHAHAIYQHDGPGTPHYILSLFREGGSNILGVKNGVFRQVGAAVGLAVMATLR
eukprot:1393660-Amorphochlora_amoeboformis.AAC.3